MNNKQKEVAVAFLKENGVKQVYNYSKDEDLLKKARNANLLNRMEQEAGVTIYCTTTYGDFGKVNHTIEFLEIEPVECSKSARLFINDILIMGFAYAIENDGTFIIFENEQALSYYNGNAELNYDLSTLEAAYNNFETSARLVEMGRRNKSYLNEFGEFETIEVSITHF